MRKEQPPVNVMNKSVGIRLNMKNNYDDIIELSRPASHFHQPMSMHNRAAQFAPFAALTGFDSFTDEAARLTKKKPELTASMQDELNGKIKYLSEHITERPTVTVMYFIPDLYKEGGSFAVYKGDLRRIDEFERRLIFTDRTELLLDDIIKIELSEFLN